MNATVDVFSDVICPWCYIGKRRLEKAIVRHGGPVRVHWLPFQLNPSMPKEGISRREYRTKKFGSWERSQELDARVAAEGKAEGIDFAFDRIERTPNTLDAHRLIWLIKKAFKMQSSRGYLWPTSSTAETSVTARKSSMWSPKLA